MRLRLGRPRVALIVAPHPDDETIGAFGLMRTLRCRGTQVRVLIVTDGGASHPGSRRWPRARLARARRGETRRAVRRLGIAAGGVSFLDLPDGALPTMARLCERRLSAAVRRIARLDLIVGPAPDDDHADHRTVARSLARIAPPRIRRLSYKVWPAGGREPRAALLPLDPQTRLAKRHAVSSYRTQAGAITDDPVGFSMTARQIAAFSRAQERFRETRR